MRSILSLTTSLWFLLAGAAMLHAEPRINTMAGTGQASYMGDGGPALAAQLNNPFGVIVAPDGDIVFCDTGNHCIRRISRKDGKIITLVGSGQPGYSGDGGPPLEAKLNEPYEIRFHPGGDLYWVEMKNHIVRRLDARKNVVEPVAGTGVEGFSGDGGRALHAQFKQPHSLVFDETGTYLFICDLGNHRIRRVNVTSGIIRTWCGTGQGAPTPDGAMVGPETPLNGPRALDRDRDGNLWLALREGNQVFRIDMTSDSEKPKLHHVAGSGKKGFSAEPEPATTASLSGPKGVAISPDGKQVYLADTESHSVRAIDLTSTPPTLRLIAGTGAKGDGPSSPDPLACAMARLHGVGIDPLNGDLYIGDSEAHQVRKIEGLPGGAPRAALGTYRTEEFMVAGKSAKITIPKDPAPGNPWIWRCRFYGAFPAVDEALLAAGWHVALVDIVELFGGAEAMDIFDAFYEEVRHRYSLAPRPVMEGFSRGGLPAMSWTIRHPDRVAGIYLDAPVLDIHTWPRRTSPDLWKQCMAAYGLQEATADTWEGPLEQLAGIAAAKVPIFLVAGGADQVVPYLENGGILEERYRAAGGDIRVIVKAGADHHPHSLYDPSPVVEWAIGLK
jgi:sugar lactone lactonase YvrE